MDLNELLYKRLSESKDIADVLAVYAGAPAIFNSECPNDTQTGWSGKQYPRIVYRVFRQANAERNSAGSVYISVHVDKDQMLLEQICSEVKNRLANVLMLPSDTSPTAFAWARSETYLIEGSAVIGKDLVFDILEFGNQITFGPDPVVAVSDFIKNLAEKAFVVSIDTAEDIVEATDDAPVIYVKIDNQRKDHESYGLIWINCTVKICIIAPSGSGRGYWIRHLYTEIFRYGEAIFSDGTPLRFVEISADNRADYLTDGQIAVKSQYTVTSARVDKPTNLLNHANF